MGASERVCVAWSRASADSLSIAFPRGKKKRPILSRVFFFFFFQKKWYEKNFFFSFKTVRYQQLCCFILRSDQWAYAYEILIFSRCISRNFYLEKTIYIVCGELTIVLEAWIWRMTKEKILACRRRPPHGPNWKKKGNYWARNSFWWERGDWGNWGKCPGSHSATDFICWVI